MRLQDISCHRSGCESSGTDVDEFPASQRIPRHAIPSRKLKMKCLRAEIMPQERLQQESIFHRMRGASFGNDQRSAGENDSVRHA